MPWGHHYGGGRFLYNRGSVIFFTFLVRREVVLMYVTWELLFLFGAFILALLTYIDNHNKKR